MSEALHTLLIFGGAILAGFIGALTGLGGGIIIVPLLTIGLGFDMNYAIGAALISVIATSTGSASAYIRDGLTNIQIGIFLVVATTIGAVGGAILSSYTPTAVISILFGGILIFTAIMSFVKKGQQFVPAQPDSVAYKMQLQGEIIEQGKNIQYEAKNAWGGFAVMVGAGVLSALLGIGSGVLKVLAMDNIMKLPFKVSTTTSSFMIGITAIASAVMYLQKGYIVPAIAAPVLLGVLLGAIVGAKLLPKINTKVLKQVFAIIVLIVAVQMIYKGISELF